MAQNLAWLGYSTIDGSTGVVCGIYRIVADPHPDYPGAVAVQNLAGQVFPLDRRLASDIAEPITPDTVWGKVHPAFGDKGAKSLVPKGFPTFPFEVWQHVGLYGRAQGDIRATHKLVLREAAWAAPDWYALVACFTERDEARAFIDRNQDRP